ncbi:DUF6788 family protein [Tomitella gaofuii]|uniref:DUF6788 family protein n=1 Tax=Tomitella gaofuii TaxID=2760083 RepID=UPI0015FC1C67|nr:DUF6788 family protein [Tomitella gaofuii]
MPGPSLEELETRRARLYEQLVQVGDFRRGSVSENYRRCGKRNCACARAGHPGHGPRLLWTRSVPGQGTRGRQLARGEVAKVRAELAAYERFAALTAQLTEVNELICEARPPDTPAQSPPASADAEKGGSSTRSPP